MGAPFVRMVEQNASRFSRRETIAFLRETLLTNQPQTAQKRPGKSGGNPEYGWRKALHIFHIFRIFPDFPEHFSHGIQEVSGSIPLISTKLALRKACFRKKTGFFITFWPGLTYPAIQAPALFAPGWSVTPIFSTG